VISVYHFSSLFVKTLHLFYIFQTTFAYNGINQGFNSGLLQRRLVLVARCSDCSSQAPRRSLKKKTWRGACDEQNERTENDFCIALASTLVVLQKWR
jgi:hypothetical protein